MDWPGHLIVTLRAGHSLSHVPTHLDCLLGAGQPARRLDGGPIDRALRRWGNAFRASCVYHAKKSLGRVGEQHVGFDQTEEDNEGNSGYLCDPGPRD